jgi:hypothetical protein
MFYQLFKSRKQKSTENALETSFCTTLPLHDASPIERSPYTVPPPVQRFPCTKPLPCPPLPLGRKSGINLPRPFKFKTLPPFPCVAIPSGGLSCGWGTSSHPTDVPPLLLKQPTHPHTQPNRLLASLDTRLQDPEEQAPPPMIQSPPLPPVI